MTFIKAEGISKIFRTKERVTTALENISFEVEKNQFVALVGPSGCGKTTLLKILAGLVKKTAGGIFVEGNGAEHLVDYGIVFQTPNLLPWRNVTENVLLPIEFKSMRKDEYRSRALELLTMAGLTGFEEAHQWELSGGMQQRVAIARALITRPNVLLMDEPFGSLDAITRDIMGLELLRIWENERTTVFFVTHSVPEAVLLSDKVIVMATKPGRIAKVVDIPLRRPRDLKLRDTPEFIRYTSIITNELYSGYRSLGQSGSHS